MVFERRLRPIGRSIQSTRHDRITLPLRPFTTTLSPQQDVIETTPSTPPPPPTSTLASDLANKVHTPRSERKLLANHGLKPIGSRRRRAAIAFTNNIPFSQLPYQCFQEARKVLMEDRVEKVEEIAKQRGRIERLREKVGGLPEEAGRERAREGVRLRSMRMALEELKVLADVNDPVVKKRFEDGDGDMSKPIYRHLAKKQWHSYKRKVLIQRITQMNLIPDVLPSLYPIVSTSLSFSRAKIQHGDIVPSTISEVPPTLQIQPFDKGDKLVTIAVINPDVPDVSKDGFAYRCHFLAANIPISPTQTRVDFADLDAESQVIIPWLPPYAQKGLPYQRLGIFILEQADAAPLHANDGAPTPQRTIDIAAVKTRGRYTRRENFILRSLVDALELQPIGVDMFRTKWDEGTAGVMERAGVIGAYVEFRRKRVEPLPYQRLKGERFR